MAAESARGTNIPRKRSRTEKELQPIAMQVSGNTELMQRFRAAIGSQSRAQAAEVSKDITEYAQKLDSSIRGRRNNDCSFSAENGHSFSGMIGDRMADKA
jgi:hypothetical protein